MYQLDQHPDARRRAFITRLRNRAEAAEQRLAVAEARIRAYQVHTAALTWERDMAVDRANIRRTT